MLHFDPEAHTYTLDGVEFPSVTEICRFLAYDYKSTQPWLARAAAERGRRIHEACALLDFGEEPEETPEIAGYLNAYRRFLRDYEPQWDLIEYPLGSQDLGFAGTLDRFGILSSRRTLLDIKSGTLYKSALTAQLTGYAKLLESCCGLRDPITLAALQLRGDGTYRLQDVPQDDDLLDALLYLHQTTKKG